MGMIELVKDLAATIKRFRAAPGDAVIVKSVGLGGAGREDPLYQHHGFRSRPVKSSRGIRVSLGSGTREGIVIATENYTVNIVLADGETAIYSTDTDGAEQAVVKWRADGSLELNGDDERLVMYAALNTELQALKTQLNAHVHSGGTLTLGLTGPPSIPMTLNISASQTSTIKTGG